MTFKYDTTLFHPTEGAKLFPAGEQHPGAAWFDTAECKPPAVTADTLKALAAAKAELAIQRDMIDAANSQITGQAKALGEEIEALKAAHADALAAKDAQIAGLDRDIETLVAQRDAAVSGKPVSVPAVAEAVKAEPVVTAPAEDEEAAEKAAIRREMGQLGVDQPHPRTGLTKLREALEAARAEARKAA